MQRVRGKKVREGDTAERMRRRERGGGSVRPPEMTSRPRL